MLITSSVIMSVLINRGYYMAARGYEFYLRVLKVSLTSEKQQNSAIKVVTYRKMPVTKML